MPEFMDVDDGGTPSKLNSNASGQGPRRRRRNPIAGNSQGTECKVMRQRIGPCDVPASATKDADESQKDSSTHVCASENQGRSGKYSTAVMGDECPRGDCARERPDDRKFVPRHKNFEKPRDQNGEDRKCSGRCCKCCGFFRKIMRILWPFGRKPTEQHPQNGERRYGNGRRGRGHGRGRYQRMR
ncbi:MAG: hypothetical protein LBC42_01545 [Puniceicoccales bacterium]|nr:hypothetical protein [Puniceicoccales bacterium]